MGFLPPLSLVANIQVEKVKLLPSHTYTITVWKLLLWKPLNAKVFGIDSMCYEWQMKKKNGIHVYRILSLIRVDRMSSKFCCCCVFGCPRRRCILACITTKPHVSRTHKATFHTHTRRHSDTNSRHRTDARNVFNIIWCKFSAFSLLARLFGTRVLCSIFF